MTPSGTSLARAALEQTLRPSASDRHRAPHGLGALIPLTLVSGLSFAGTLAIALDAAGTLEDAGLAAILGLIALGVLAETTSLIMRRLSPPLTAELTGFRHRSGLHTRHIPWSELAPVVLTGSAWPFEVRLLDKDGLLVAKAKALTSADREAVVEAASRIGLRDERTPSTATPAA